MSGRETSRAAGEALPRRHRLLRRADFVRCYRQGRRRHGELLILYCFEGETDREEPRLGISVSRKVGGAVVRNRTRRRIREIYRRWSERSKLPPLDLLIHVKPPTATATYSALEGELIRMLTPLIRSRRPVS